MNTTLSKTDRVYKAFHDGYVMTAKQIASRYNVKNPYDVVHRLRNEGHNIVLKTKTDTKGRTNNFYSLKTSRAA
jgi:hypothetical protein